MKFLLIEDDADDVYIISNLLKNEFGGEVDTQVEVSLQTGLKTLQAAEQAFDLCLCDLSFPESDIMASVNELAKLDVSLPIIVLTQLHDAKIARVLAEAGIEDYITKTELTGPLLFRICMYAIERNKQSLLIEKHNKALQTFCYSLSHDFKGYLRHILTLSRFIYEDLGQSKGLNEERQKWFDLLFDRIAGTQRLTFDLGLLLSVEHQTAKLTTVDLASLVRQEEAVIKNQVETTFNLSVCPEPFCIDTDASLIAIVFRNMIENAVKYNQGQPKIDVTFNAVKKDSAENSGTRVCITDNGIGIEPKYLASIGEAFFKVHSKDDYPGTGLGLHICHIIIDKLGGTLNVESQLGKGTTFEIVLPSGEGASAT